MARIAFGTAHLFGLADADTSRRLLEEAWRVGVRRFDTAPSYGAGRTEPQLGAFLTGRDGVQGLTTKVGLAPTIGTRPGRQALVSVAKALLPAPIAGRLRRSAHEAARGRFGTDEVRASVEQSLRRLGGRVDRLVLHEVRPDDVTPELLDLLAGWVAAGDVGALGVATRNDLTPAVLAATGDLLTVAHVAVGPLDPPVPLPAHVTARVGHGLLGGGGEQLHRLQTALAADPALTDRWCEAIAGTGFTGLAEVLLSRGPHTGVTDLLVATTRVERVAAAVAAAGRSEPLPPAVQQVLQELAQRCTGELAPLG